MKTAIHAVLISSLACLSGCRAYVRARQVRTVATMQGIVRVIEETKIREPLTEANVRGAVKSVAAGRDAWGNEIAYAIRPSSAQSMSYVVVSPGSDGRFLISRWDSLIYEEKGVGTSSFEMEWRSPKLGNRIDRDSVGQIMQGTAYAVGTAWERYAYDSFGNIITTEKWLNNAPSETRSTPTTPATNHMWGNERRTKLPAT